MKVHRILISLFIVLSLSSCMGIKFTYNNLDWLVPWYVEDFIELTDAQEDQFVTEFDDLWAWHRTSELPKYIMSLKRLETDITNKNMSMENLLSFQEESRIHYHTVAEKVIKQGIDLLATLSDEQMDEIREIITEDLKEDEEEIVESDKEERLKDRQKRIEKNYREWIGKLTEKQKEQIALWSAQLQSTSEFRLEYLKASRKAFLDAMDQRADKEKLQERLLYLVFDRDELHSKEHLEAREHNRDVMRQLTLVMEKSLTKKQRKRLVNRIKNYRETFEELVEEAKTAA